jgi:hypothetical protein
VQRGDNSLPLLPDAALLDIEATILVWRATGVSAKMAWAALGNSGKPPHGWISITAHMLRFSYLTQKGGIP